MLRGQNLEAAALDKLEAMHADETLKLDGTPTLVTLNTAASGRVVVVDGNHLVFFDPATLAKTGEFTVEGDAITSVHFKQGRQHLSAGDTAGSDTVTVLNVADPANVDSLLGTQPLE